MSDNKLKKEQLSFLRIYALANQPTDFDANKFYKLIHALLITHAKDLKKDNRISLEIMSSDKTGITYLICAQETIIDILSKQLAGLYPSLLITKTNEDYINEGINHKQTVIVNNWRFKNSDDAYSKLDVLLTNFNALPTNSLIAIQFVLAPNLTQLTSLSVVWIILKQIVRLIRSLLASLFRINQQFPKKLANDQNSRLEKSAFVVTVRTVVASLKQANAQKINKGLEVSLVSANFKKYKPYQSASSAKDLNLFIHRKIFKPEEVNLSKLSEIYFLPEHQLHLLSDLRLNPSLKLNPPRSHAFTKHDYIIGSSNLPDSLDFIGLSDQDRRRHLLLVGGTGMGKTTFMKNLLLQDILKGNGLALIDPHGDLAQEVIGLIPTSRLKDVIYFNPSDLKYPLSINLMELPADLSGDQLLLAKDMVAESIISIFRKIFSNDEDGGHRIEYILRNAIYTAFYVNQPTLFTLYKLLTNDVYRIGVVSHLDDPLLRGFWQGEFNKAGSYQRVKMISGVTAKLGRYWQSSVTNNILSHANSSIDFDQIIDNKKILICNLSKGSIGEDTASLLAMTVLAKIQLSVWHRSLIPSAKRHNFYLYLDEFQTFYSQSIIQLISEARKFSLSLTIAEQSLAYQKENDINVLLANIGNIVSFRIPSQLDLNHIGPLFSPYVSSHHLQNLQPYNFYLRSADVNLTRPISGITTIVKTQQDATISRKVVNRSRKLASNSN